MSFEGARPDPWRDEDYWVEKKSDLVNAWSEAYSKGQAEAFCDRITEVRDTPDELAAVISLAPPITRRSKLDIHHLIRAHLGRAA